MLRLPRILALILVSTLLAACDTPQPAPKFDEISFKDLPPIRLNVARIDVANEYVMPFKDPNVEHQMPVAPGAAVERWAGDVLQAVGTVGSAVMVIHEAAVIEIKLKTKKGVSGLFHKEQSERYEGRIRASLIVRDADNRQLAAVDAEAARSQTVREDATPNERAVVWYRMTKSLLAEFDTTLRVQANRHLKAHMR